MRWPIVIASSVVAAGVSALAMVTERPHDERATRDLASGRASRAIRMVDDDGGATPFASAMRGEDSREERASRDPIRMTDAAATEPAEAAPASTFDLDSDGTLLGGTVVRDEDGGAIANARVELMQEHGSCGVSIDHAATLATDESGRFLLRAKTRGLLYVSSPGRSAVQVSVNDDNENDLLRVPTIRLVQAATVRGRVLDADGGRAKDVKLELRWLREPENVRHSEPQTISESSGAFEIDGIPRSGVFFLTASIDEAVIARTLPLRAPPRPFEELAPITISLPPLGRIVGTVFHDDHSPWRGIPLQADSIHGDDEENAHHWIRVNSWSDDQGHFEFRGLPLGRYVVWNTLTWNASFGRFPVDVRSSIDPATVDLDEPALDEHTPGSVVAGRILCPPASGEHRPLLWLELDGPSFEQTTSVRDDGSFEFTDVPCGSFELCVEGPARDKVWFKPLTVEAGDSNLTISARVVRSRIIARFRSDSAESDSGYADLLDATSERTVTGWQWDSERDEGRLTSDELPPGTYVIEVADSWHEPARFGPFSLREDETLNVGELRLHGLPHVRGRVVDGHGRRLANARITAFLTGPHDLSKAAAAWADDTDEQGEFDLPVLHPRLLLWVVHDAAAPTIFLARDFQRTDDLELRLDPGATLRGRVVTTSGTPVPSLPVSLACRTPDDPSGGTWNRYERDTDTADDGTFVIERLPFVECRLRIGSASDDDGVLARRTIEIRDRWQDLGTITVQW